MGEVASAFVSLVPSLKGFGSKLGSDLGPQVDAAGKSAGKRFGGAMSTGIAGIGSKVFAPLAAAGAAIGVGNFLKDAIGEARESQKVGALTAQVIKTTGGAAKITAGQVGDLATAISNKTGIDDEAIQSASNLLLTFTNVRNEVGKGNDVFNQATQIATDMGAALGGDPKSAAIQLGKALNDPVKGVTALSRVGVSFTKQQKDQIKTLTESGNTLGAQKIILGELNKEFGGAAAASATSGEKLATAFGNFKEQIGTALLPVIDKVAGFLTTKIIPAVSTFISQMQSGSGAGGAFVAFIKGIWAAIQPVGAFLMGTVVPAIRGFFASFQSGGGPSAITAAFQGLVAFIQGSIIPAVMGIVTAVRGFVAVALPIVQAFVAGMMARIGPLMPQIRVIFTTIGQIITGVMGLIQAIISRVTAIIGGIWSRWGSNIMNYAAKIFGAIVQIIGGALRVISGVIKLFTAIFKGDWSGAWAAIKQIVSGALQIIKGVISAALTVIKAVFSVAWAGIKAGASAAWSGIKSAVSAGVGHVVDLVRSLPGKARDALGNLGGMLFDAGSRLIQGLIDGIMSKIRAVTDAVSSIASKIKGFFPGSPIKEGPLRSWNNGGVGERLGGLLEDGLDRSRAKVAAASRGLAGSVALDSAVGVGAGLAAASGGAAVFHLHDRDGVLLGTMHGVAAGAVKTAATTQKWSR